MKNRSRRLSIEPPRDIIYNDAAAGSTRLRTVEKMKINYVEHVTIELIFRKVISESHGSPRSLPQQQRAEAFNENTDRTNTITVLLSIRNVPV